MTTHLDGAPSYADVVDIDRYPIHDLGSSDGRAFLKGCREELAATGVCQLEGFLTSEAVGTMTALAAELAELAWVSDQLHTVYFEKADPAVLASHPRARVVRSAKHGIAYDYIPDGAPLSRLYASDDLTSFIAAVLGKKVLFRSADPLDAMQITTFAQGQELGWHFDRSEFSVTVMYQQADLGGDFDYYPGLRSRADENFAGVQRVLDGDETGVVRLTGSPGTLAVFRGQHALHRVTPVQGSRPRINSVLTYGERPDMRLNNLTSLLFYGRTS